MHSDLELPNGDPLPDTGAMFIGEKGNLLLPHFMELPRHIVDGVYQELDTDLINSFELGTPIRNYEAEGKMHYHQLWMLALERPLPALPFPTQPS